MKKIAFISELYGSPKQGGENLAMFHTSQALIKKGLDVSFYSYSGQSGNKINNILPLRIASLPFVRDILVCPLVGLRLFKVIENKYDQLIIASPFLVAIRRPKSDLIIVCHAIRTQKIIALGSVNQIKYKLLFNPLVMGLFKIIEKNAYKKADKVIVLRQRQKNFLIKKMGIDEKKIVIIPNGIDTDFYYPAKKHKDQIVFVGRATVAKGFDIVLKAANKIRADIVVVTQKIDPSFNNSIKKVSNIRLVFRPTPIQIAKIYRDSLFFILPSRDEEQPLTVLEAMASGIPVVVSKKAASEIVQDKVNGYILKDFSSDELIEVCNKLLQDKEAIDKFGRLNRKKVKSSFSLNKQTDLLVKNMNESSIK